MTFLKTAAPRAVLVAGVLAGVWAGGGACTPTVRVEAPREPITINLNIRLDAEVRVRLEEQAQSDIEKRDDIF